MSHISGLLRALLNINTIWGLMILAAFGVCLARHYQSQRTLIPTELISADASVINIRVTALGSDAQVARSFAFSQGANGPTLAPLDEDVDPSIEVVRADLQPDGLMLTWRSDEAGQAVVAVAAPGAEPVTASRQRVVNMNTFSQGVLIHAKSAFNFALGLVAAFVLFLGLMKVGEDAGVVQLIAKGIRPAIRFLFPEVPPNHPANGAILMNWTTTILGLGNAATPFGLKAMQELQSLNPNKKVASNSMVMLLGFNTAGLALLPTTLIAARQSAGVSDPFSIIPTCLFAGAVSTVAAIIAVKLLGALPVFSYEKASAEAPPDPDEAAPDEATDPAAAKGDA